REDCIVTEPFRSPARVSARRNNLQLQSWRDPSVQDGSLDPSSRTRFPGTGPTPRQSHWDWRWSNKPAEPKQKKKPIMKTLNSWLLSGTVALLVTTNSAFSQAPPTLTLRLFAGVNITGTGGSIYVVQSTSDPTQTNSWRSLAFVELLATNFLF